MLPQQLRLRASHSCLFWIQSLRLAPASVNPISTRLPVFVCACALQPAAETSVWVDEAAGWRLEADGVKSRKLHVYARCPLLVRGTGGAGGGGGAAPREEATEPGVLSAMFHSTERRLHVHTHAASHAASPLLVNTSMLLSERCSFKLTGNYLRVQPTTTTFQNKSPTPKLLSALTHINQRE